MTDFDKKLIEKANSYSRWDYRSVDALIDQAQTDEARMQLYYIRCELRDMALETC